MLPEVHFLDVTVRQETLAGVRGDPVILQLPLVPCYALTVHKTQAYNRCATKQGATSTKQRNACLCLTGSLDQAQGRVESEGNGKGMF